MSKLLYVLLGVFVFLVVGCSKSNQQEISEDQLLSFCEESENEPFKLLCLKEVAIKEKNEKICEKITNPYDDIRNSCISKVAELNKDIALCEKISNEQFMVNCMGAIIETSKDHSECEKLLNQQSKDLCNSIVNQ